MTRKDYELIAKVFKGANVPNPDKDEWNKAYSYGIKQSALDMADALAADNPRFDRERFLKACGVE
jgi:hypothetical protein